MKWSLQRRIEHFLKRTRMRPTRFGLEVIGDPQLVFQLRHGRAARPPTAAKILAYLDRAEQESGASPSTSRRRRR